MKHLSESIKTHFRLLLFLFFMINTVIVTEAASCSAIPAHQSIQFYETQKKVDFVLFLMQKRLCIMHEVARTKWKNDIAIEDKPREQQIIDRILQESKKYGIDEDWAQKFFQAQFDAAKSMQMSDFSQWSDQGINKFDSVLDLKTEIRSYLDKISEELIQALAKIYPDIKLGKVVPFIPPNPLWRRDSDCIDVQSWNIAVAPLLNQ